MSVSVNGVTIGRSGRGRIALLLLGIVELIFSIVLVLVLGAHIFFPGDVGAVAGVSNKLSYQGRLTDLSGDPLGGTGTNYCFRFAVYDAASNGTKVWPAGTPNSTTVKVKDGVFSAALGTADTLDLDFTTNDTLYLSVEVNATPTTCSGSWEILDIRQRIDAVGYARAAENVYSSLLRAQTGSGKVQVGTGAGAATPVFLGLDVKNTDEAVGASCGTNGQLWYNSADSRARVCQGSAIQDLVGNLLVRDEGANIGRASTALDFVGAGVVVDQPSGGVIRVSVPVGSISGGTTRATLGEIVFSNANGVSFGVNGQTITASAAGGGGGAPTLSVYLNDPGAGVISSNMAVSNATMGLVPINGGKVFPGNMTLSTLLLGLSGNITATSVSSSNTQSFSVGFYTLNGNTLSLAFSASTTIGPAAGTSNTALSNGPRFLSLHSSQFNIQPTFSQTNYWIAIWQRSSNLAMQASWFGHRFFTSNQRSGTFGFSNATATSKQLFPYWGHYSASFSTAMPSSVTQGHVVGASAWAGFSPYIMFNNVNGNF